MEHALLAHYFCEYKNIYSTISVFEVIAQYDKKYFSFGHAVCFIEKDKDHTFLIGMDRKSKKWKTFNFDSSMKDIVKNFSILYRAMAQSSIQNEIGALSGVFLTSYNSYHINFDKYSAVRKGLDNHYGKHDISRIEFYEKYIEKEFKKKYGKEFINNRKKPKDCIYVATPSNLLISIYNYIKNFLNNKK